MGAHINMKVVISLLLCIVCFATAGPISCPKNHLKVPANVCTGHRCDNAACPCGCECGTSDDPGLCYVPKDSPEYRPAASLPGLPSTMKAVQATGAAAAGDFSKIHVNNIAVPKPGHGQVLIQVAASSVNPVDWKIIEKGTMSALLSWPHTLGFDVSGTI